MKIYYFFVEQTWEEHGFRRSRWRMHGCSTIAENDSSYPSPDDSELIVSDESSPFIIS